MKAYREAAVVAQRRRQIRRLGVVLTIIVVVFLGFVVGMMVGVQMERKNKTWSPPDSPGRQKIVMPPREPSQFPVPSAPHSEPSLVPDAPQTNQAESAAPAAKEVAPEVPVKEEEVKLTFYDTLTKQTPHDTGAPTPEKPRPSKPAVTEAKPAESKGGYYVYVASFQNREYAHTLKDRLAKGGYDVRIVPVELPGRGKWYRVTVGGYATREEAERVKNNVAKAEKIRDALVVLEK